LGLDNIRYHEDKLLKLATDKLSEIEGINIIGEATEKTAVLSFLFKYIHPYDLGILLDQMGIAVRTGHHCAQPLVVMLRVPGTARASFGIYNTGEEVLAFADAMKKAVGMLR